MRSEEGDYGILTRCPSVSDNSVMPVRISVWNNPKEQRHRKENTPDTIVSLTHFDIAFSLIQVTAPTNANDHSHFVIANRDGIMASMIGLLQCLCVTRPFFSTNLNPE